MGGFRTPVGTQSGDPQKRLGVQLGYSAVIVGEGGLGEFDAFVGGMGARGGRGPSAGERGAPRTPQIGGFQGQHFRAAVVSETRRKIFILIIYLLLFI